MGQLVSTFQWQTGITATGLTQTIYFLILPWLLVHAARMISRRRLRTLWPWVVVPASLVFSLTLLLVSWGLYLLIDHPGFPLISALIAGLLLAASDPSWSSQMIERQRSLLVLLEGEGLWVELFALVGLMVLVKVGSLDELRVAEFALIFTRLLLSSLLVAWLLSFIVRPLITWNPGLTLPLAYLSFWGAEWGLGLPGAAVCLSLVLLSRPQLVRGGNQLIEPGARLGADLLVLILGFSLTLSMFTERYWVMLAAIGLCLMARLPLLWATSRWFRHPLSQRSASLWWRLPVHGPVTLALVLSIPVSVTAWWTIQAACYGVVLFELLIQRPLASRSVSGS
ncbi:cation:proton antiporter [Ferrimonas futtsuensis]|uniref:cation:proton antiporter n=1 Tax=Ferrimonas futtsuensis TaxID=364764 RepID=UPI0012F87CA8|nr:cation:proton antiporter [Ferrimonas futtsuensis]